MMTVGPALLDEFPFGSLLSSFGVPQTLINNWTNRWQGGRLQEALKAVLHSEAFNWKVEPTYPRRPPQSVPVPRDQGMPREPSPTGTANNTPQARDHADPVNPANGELYMERADLSFPGFGVTFAHGRTYRSRIEYSGTLGPGWDFTYNRRLLSVPDTRRRIWSNDLQLAAEYEVIGLLPLADLGLLGDPQGEPSPTCGPQLLYMTGEGTTLRFRQVGETATTISYESATGIQLTLHGHKSNGTIVWSMTEPSGIRQEFNEHGLLVAIEDSNGVGLAIAWEAYADDWRVASVTDSVGRVTKYEYGTGNDARLRRVWEATSGLEVRYAYNAQRELMRATDSTGRSESYEYDYDANRPDGDWGPEGYLVPACELTCAPASSSCDAGGACDEAVAATMGQCLGSCAECAEGCRLEGDPGASPPIPACYDACDESCAEGVGQTPSCQQQCDDECEDNKPNAVLFCNQAWVAKGQDHCEQCEDQCEAEDSACHAFSVCFGAAGGLEGDGSTNREKFETCISGSGLDRLVDSLDDLVAGFEVLTQAIADTIGCGANRFCSWFRLCERDDDCYEDTRQEIEQACDQNVRQCCRDGNECMADSCNVGHDCFDDCRASFMGEANGNGCEAPSSVFGDEPPPGTTMDDWALTHGCVPEIQDACPDRCTFQCERRCETDCHAVCDTKCGEICHTADCAGYCESLDLMGECQTGCVDGCIEAAHEKGPFVGAKYGYLKDLNHNIIRVKDGNDNLYLEVTYGTDISRPDFDSVVSQNYGGFTSQIYYRDLEGEERDYVSAPTSGPAATYIDDREAFVPVDICPAACETPQPLPQSLYVPWSGLLLTFASGPTGGLKVVNPLGFHGRLPPNLLLLTRSSNRVYGESTAEPMGPPPLVPRHPPFDVLLTQGRVTFTPVGVHSYSITGGAQALNALAALDRVTVFSGGRGLIQVYPGSPKGSVRVAKGVCHRPFNALVTSAELRITPTDACSAELVVAPLSTAVENPPLKGSFDDEGNAALDDHDLFQKSAVVPLRGQVQWRLKGGASGRYEAYAGTTGTAGDAHRAAAMNTALNLPLSAHPRASNGFRAPLYVSHEMENQLLDQGDHPPGRRSPYFPDTNSVPLDESDRSQENQPVDYCGPSQPSALHAQGAGTLPTRAAVMMDFYGVPWTYYFDRAGRVIRSVNHSTSAIRSTNYDAAGQVEGIEGPLGERTCFRHDGDGNLRRVFDFPHPGVIGQTERFEPIQYLFSWAHLGADHQTVRLWKIYDPRGTNRETPPNKVYATNLYDLDGNLQSTLNGVGVRVRYELVGGNGPDRAMPRRRIDPDGSITEFEYDVDTGGTTRITVGLGRPDAVTTEAVYDPAGRPVWKRGSLGEETTFVWSGGRLQSLSRQANDLTETTTFSYDGDGQVVSVNRGDRSIDLTYDAIGGLRRTRVTALDGSATTTNTCTRHGPGGRLLEQVMPEGNRMRYSYDGEGRVQSVFAGVWAASGSWDVGCTSTFGATPASGYLATMEYDVSGRATRVTDARGVELQLKYDGFGQRTRITDGEGSSLRTGYDELGNVAWTSTYGSSGASVFQRRPQWGDVGLEAAEEIFYDDAGRLVEQRRWHFRPTGMTVEPVGDGYATTRLGYDAVNRKTTVTDDAGFPTSYFSDPAGRLSRTVLPGGTEISSQHLDGGRTIVSQWPSPTPSGSQHSTTTLTGWGAVASVTTQDTGQLVALASMEYDPHRRLTSSRTPADRRTTTTYDAFDRPRQKTTSLGASVGELVFLDWNRNGWLNSHRSASGDLPNGVTLYEYDALGRIRKRTDPIGGIATTSYVLASQTPDVTYDERGFGQVFSYDVVGNLERVDAWDAEGGQAQTREFTYDPLGRAVFATRSGGLPSFVPSEITTHLGWDSLGNRIFEQTGAGSGDYYDPFVIHSGFDGRGLLTKSIYHGDGGMEVTRTYDSLSRLQTVGIPGEPWPAVRFSYGMSVGPPTVRHDSNDGVATFQYDPLGRLVNLWHGSDAQTELANWRWAIPVDGVPRLAGLRKGEGAPEVASVFTADNAGGLKSETHALTGLGAVAIQPHASTVSANGTVFSYVGTGSSWTRYILDSRHNFDNVQSPSGSFSPPTNGADEYATFAGRAITYDDAGAVLSDGLATYSYDNFGELTSVNGGAAGSRRYVRDAFGRIVYERDETPGAGNPVTRFGYDGWRRSVRMLPNGDLETMVDGQGLDEHLVRVDSSGQHLFYHQERNGNVYVVTDEGGDPLEWYDYSAYGDVTIRSPQGTVRTKSAINNRFGFQGQAFDESLGLVDMRRRFYRPSMGRFLQRDPIGLAGGSNLYAFADSSPLSFRDPFGLDKQLLTGDAVANYMTWSGRWSSRSARAQTRLEEVEKRIWRDNPALYADNINRYRLGRLDALGPEYQAVAGAAALASTQLAVSDEILQWLESRQALGVSVTLDQVNRQALDIAYWRSVYTDTLMTALLVGYPSLGMGGGAGGGRAVDVAAAESVRLRVGESVVPIEKTFEMALNPDLYIAAVVEKYGINLQGSGQTIKVVLNPNIASLGRINPQTPNLIEIGLTSMSSEANLANTIAHELNHARSYLQGGTAPESTAYPAGNALESYIKGER